MRYIARHMPLLLVFAAIFFFLWMFLAAQSLEATAEAGGFRGAGVDAMAVAQQYSYEWRHGMVGGWPLYVPGFFAVAAAVALWSPGRPLRGLLTQGGLALGLALVAAELFSPIGARWLIASFERDTGLALIGPPREGAWPVVLPGIFTVVSWAALVLAIQMSISRRSVWPLVAPLTCYAALAVVRPGDFGDLVVPWAQALVRGEGVAVVSTVLIPPVAAALTAYTLRRDRSARPGLLRGVWLRRPDVFPRRERKEGEPTWR